MKKTNKIFVYVLCILLSALIASATLMAGATDAAVSEESSSATGNTSFSTVPSTKVVTTTEKDITDIISEVVSENEWQDDLSEAGNEIKSFSQKMADFLNDCIKAIETASEKLVEFLKQIFRMGTFD